MDRGCDEFGTSVALRKARASATNSKTVGHPGTPKFGPLDAATLAQLSATDSETLLVWGKRVLNAKSLADVFRESAVH